MNEVENEILMHLDKKNKIIFDIGCFRGSFTKNLIKNEIKLGIESNFYLFDPNPNVKDYLNSLLENKRVKYFNLALDNIGCITTLKLSDLSLFILLTTSKVIFLYNIA